MNKNTDAIPAVELASKHDVRVAACVRGFTAADHANLTDETLYVDPWVPGAAP